MKTNIRREFPPWMKLVVPLVFDPLLKQTPREAAGSALNLLLAPEFQGVTGALFSKIKRFRQVTPLGRAFEKRVGVLWELSERLVLKGQSPLAAAE